MANYIPNVWVTGDIVTADKLNHMENNISTALNCEPYRHIQHLTGINQISSMTVIEDKLFLFRYTSDNSFTTGNKIFTFDADGKLTETSDTFTSNLGHANTVDWNRDTHYLVTTWVPKSGDLVSEYKIYLIPNVTAATRAFDRTHIDTLGIPLDMSNPIQVDNIDVFCQYRLNAIWGPNNLGRNDFLYVVSDESDSLESGVRHLALIQLAKGSKQFTYGTINQGAATDEFNGTFNVVRVWTKAWTKINGIIQGCNDMCYWGGKIYELPAPSSTSSLPLMIHSFGDFGTTWNTEYLEIPYRNSSGETTTTEKEGIAIYNRHLYIGSHKAGIYVYEF